MKVGNPFKKQYITMNKIDITLLLTLLLLLLGACSPKSNEMGAIDVTPMGVEGIAFTITPIIRIKYYRRVKCLPAIPLWMHPQDAAKVKVSLRIPSKVLTRDLWVYKPEEAQYTVSPPPLQSTSSTRDSWTIYYGHCSGGVDKEKTWYLDLDAEGVSRYFARATLLLWDR